MSLRMDIARVYVALIRSLWSSHASERNTPQLAANMHTDTNAVQHALTAARAKMQAQPILEGLTDLLRYGRASAVILSEALLTLSLTSSSSKDTGTCTMLTQLNSPSNACIRTILMYRRTTEMHRSPRGSRPCRSFCPTCLPRSLGMQAASSSC